MRIGIDAKWYFNGPVGPRSYIRNLVECLAAQDSTNEYVIYLNKHDDLSAVRYSAPNFTTKPMAPSQSWLRNMLAFTWVAKRDKLDVLFTSNFSPLVCSCKRVVIIYDILFETHPELFSFIERVFFKRMRIAAHVSDKVITISDYCKDTIADVYRVPREKIESILLGCNESFSVCADEHALDAVKKKWELPERYILYVGRLNVRKNLLRLIEAFSEIDDKEIKLVIVGAKDWKTSDLSPAVEASPARDRLIFLGFVPDEDLPRVYQAATAFVYVPLAEGFGFPPLEAMGCGIPVITSNTTSLPEVVGDCALTVDPHNASEVRDAINRLLGDPKLMADLATRGAERAKTFSWKATIRKTLDVIEKVVRGA